MIYFTRTPGVSPKKVTRHVTSEVKMNIDTTDHRSHPKAEIPSNEALLLGKRWSWELVSMVDIAWWCHLHNLQNYTLLTISKIVWSHLAGDTVWYCMILTSFFRDPTHNDLQWSLNTSSWSYWVTPSERLWVTLSRLGFLPWVYQHLPYPKQVNQFLHHSIWRKKRTTNNHVLDDHG